MPYHLPQSLHPLLSTGPGTAGATGGPGFTLPHTDAFALTPLSVPDGFGPGRAHRPDSRVEGMMGGQRRLRPRAVILDQDPNVLEILGTLLEDENYEVTLSARLLEQDELRRLEPDVIIADAEFNHGEDGHVLYNESLAREDGSPIRVIYCTTQPEVVAELRDREIPILLKPFDLETLLALVCQGDTGDI